VSLHGRSAFDWYAACREGTGLRPVQDARAALTPGAPRVDWM
jgi:hypothetical protein